MAEEAGRDSLTLLLCSEVIHQENHAALVYRMELSKHRHMSSLEGRGIQLCVPSQNRMSRIPING